MSETSDKGPAIDRTVVESLDMGSGQGTQVPGDKGDSSGDPGPFGPRAAHRRELRIEIDPKLWKLLGRLRRDLDQSASGIVRASLREMCVRLYGPGCLR